MSELTTIARPYAKAAFDFAVEKGALDQWSQMLTFAAEVTRNKEMAELLSGSVSSEKASEIFIAVCGEQFDEFGQNLIKVMAENGRLRAFPEVCEEFLVLKQEHEKEMDVDVVSATKLTKKQLTDQQQTRAAS
jgi:F-type H+-transporting ATPase subunit delta